MSVGRIVFAGSPWPEGHAIEEFEWTARAVGDALWFDLHLRSAGYDAEREIEDNEDGNESSDWQCPGVWGNYHACILSSTYWGGEGGFRVCALGECSADWLDGRRFEVDPVEGVIEDPDERAFHIYLLGHDSVANHRIEFRRIGDSERFDILWTGEIALTYAGEDELAHRFEARVTAVPYPTLPFASVS